MRVERGYVLFVVLVAILLVLGLSALAIRQSLTDGRAAFAGGVANTLFVLADAPLALLNDADTRQMISTDGGLVQTLITHHANQPNKQAQSIGFLCFDKHQGVANFHPSRLSFNSSSARCQSGQAWLWFVLSDEPVSQAFAHVPAGVAVDDLTSVAHDVLYHRLLVYSLASTQPFTPCHADPIKIKACLDDDGITHQMLVQEYGYGYE